MSSIPSNLTPQAFVDKWRYATLKERSAYQEHFLDLCHLIGHPTPAEVDPTGENFAFEYGAAKTSGGNGFADVFKRRFFGWEYKGKHADLDKAYQQLLNYREDLHNPPLLVVCDIERIIIHTNFTNTRKRIRTLTLDDLLTPDGRRALKAIFEHPDFFAQAEMPAQVTQQAADRFAELAGHLRATLPDTTPQTIAHFLIRCLFCLFAEDVGLLNNNVFTKLVEQGRVRPERFTSQLRQLFAAMATGGDFGVDEVRRFNGGLFNDDAALPLDRKAIEILAGVVALDWSTIEPSIFGELFVRGLDPAQRSKLGAQYTDRSDIELIVEPVLMAPLRKQWTEVQQQARDLAAQRDEAQGTKRAKLDKQVRDGLIAFMTELAQMRVLDAACGSGNFLYVSLVMLLDLWQTVAEVYAELTQQRLSPLPDITPSPAQLHGIEINEYARELAQATIWIGYIQWLIKKGYGFPDEPILKPIDSIEHRDAILNPDGTEPEWPACEVIVGNPPFLGDRKMRQEIGDEYVEKLRQVYAGRVTGVVDLVCYWFEKARAMVESGSAKRVGLLATTTIRNGASRRVLERIKATGDIFWAFSDRDWTLAGATVHVAMIGFDNGAEKTRTLNDQVVASINADLTTSLDLTQAQTLIENLGLSFAGTKKYGPFDIDNALAQSLLSDRGNPNGRSNRDVVKPWVNGMDIARGRRNMWIIDFGVDMPSEQAAQYEKPFEYLRKNVKPQRDKEREKDTREKWWLFQRPRPGMREAIAGLSRYIVTLAVSKHRIFTWLTHPTIPDQQLIVIARDDDYFFGVLYSKIHELWSRAKGTQLREAESGTRYTPTNTFETFPFPWLPGQEPRDDPRVQVIAEAARVLVQQRDAWLNPPGITEAELKKRTLTNLYNAQPTWLENAHRRLDEAVFAAYGWPADLSDDEILARLLALNLARAAQQTGGA